MTGAVVVYLSVPPSGSEPSIEITRGGTLLESLLLRELLSQPADAAVTELATTNDDSGRRSQRRVRSARKPEETKEGGASDDG